MNFRRRCDCAECDVVWSDSGNAAFRAFPDDKIATMCGQCISRLGQRGYKTDGKDLYYLADPRDRFRVVKMEENL